LVFPHLFYIAAVFAVAGALFSGVLALRGNMRGDFELAEANAMAMSEKAVLDAGAAIAEAFKGADISAAFIPELSGVIAKISEEEMAPVFLSGSENLVLAFKDKRKDIFKKIGERAGETIQDGMGSANKISPALWEDLVKNSLAPAFKSGLASDAAWDEISSCFGPVLAKIPLYALAFLLLAFIEPFFYFLFRYMAKRMQKARKRAAKKASSVFSAKLPGGPLH
jgi:hypothetical protein